MPVEERRLKGEGMDEWGGRERRMAEDVGGRSEEGWRRGRKRDKRENERRSFKRRSRREGDRRRDDAERT